VRRDGLRRGRVAREKRAHGKCVSHGRRLEKVEGTAVLAERVYEARMARVHGEEDERRPVGAARIDERRVGVEKRFDGLGVALSDGGGESFERVAHGSPQFAGGGVPSAGGTAAAGGVGAGAGAGAAGGSPFGNASALQKEDFHLGWG